MSVWLQICIIKCFMFLSRMNVDWFFFSPWLCWLKHWIWIVPYDKNFSWHEFFYFSVDIRRYCSIVQLNFQAIASNFFFQINSQMYTHKFDWIFLNVNLWKKNVLIKITQIVVSYCRQGQCLLFMNDRSILCIWSRVWLCDHIGCDNQRSCENNKEIKRKTKTTYDQNKVI